VSAGGKDDDEHTIFVVRITVISYRWNDSAELTLVDSVGRLGGCG
jgi:hypothetical protein